MELDGSQHIAQGEADDRRTAFLRRQGFQVLRFWDNDVLTKTSSVLQQIFDAMTELKDAAHNAFPSPLVGEGQGEGEDHA